MYEIECNENRIKVFKDGKFYVEMDQPTPVACKHFVEDYSELLDILPKLDSQTLEKVLSIYNADYNGVKYHKQKRGQLTIYDF